jgi:Zn-dependent protease
LDDNFLLTLAVNALPLVFAITVHEVAHGYIAGKLGDPTARMMGRITLNPLAHVDPLGTVILPLLMLIGSGGQAVFGWAKPVPVNFANLRRMKRDSILVAFAGPGSNFLQFALWGALILIIRLTVGLPAELEFANAGATERITVPLVLMALAGLQWNFWLGVLNLFPILPLDGGRILHSLLPFKAAQTFGRLEPFGFFILIALLSFGGAYLGFLFAPYQWILGVLLR